MFYEIMEVVQGFLYGAPVASTTYEYWLAVLLSGILCVLVLYIPFAIVRWFFRGFLR